MGCLLTLCLSAGSIAAPWDGFEGFFAVLEDENVRADAPGAADLIFVLGKAPAFPTPRAFREAVREGAVLCIATEDPDARALLAEFDLSLAPEIHLALNPFACFKGQPDCPLITAFAGEAPLLAGVAALVANRAREVRGAGKPLAFFDRRGGASRAFAREVRAHRGRVIAIGDQSLFINLMLPERDNERFLRNLLAGARTAAVYLHGRRCASALESMPPSLTPAPFPSFPDLAPTIADFNRLLADAQAAAPVDSLNRSAFPVLCAAAGMLAVWLLLRRVLGVWQPPRAPFGAAPPAAPAAFAARRLACAAPRRLRPKLLRRAAACDRPGAFARFVKELDPLEGETPHGPAH